MSNDSLSGKHAHMMTMFMLLLAFRSNLLDPYGRGKHVNWQAGERA